MNKYTIKYGESLIDVSLKLYGDISYVFELIKLNPTLQNIDNNNITGLEIEYNIVQKQPIIAVIKPIKKIVKNVTIGEKQNIFDLSLQIYGNIENVFSVLNLSGIDSINEVEIKGVKFNYDYVPLKIPKYLNEKRITIASKSNYVVGDIVWDGVYDIWDGVYDLAY